jgi:hypothetical protein
MVRFLVVAVAFVGLVSMPCWLALIIAADDVLGRGWRAVRRRIRTPFSMWRGQPWRDRRRLARLDRTVRRCTRSVPREPAGPPIEQVAADLRRLSRQRLGMASRSELWHAAVQRAYDDRLRLACRELRIEQHLDELSDIDLDIERVRVEGALQAAGIHLYTAGGVSRRQDQR